jgi:hypothetical protein
VKINTDALWIIGQGSEWFWTALSGTVLVVTFIAIFLQLRAQRSANLYDQSAAWQRDWNDEHNRISRLVLMLDLEGRTVESGLPPSISEPGDYFERLGYLVLKGHLRSADVWHDLRLVIGRWWTLTEPYIRHDRIATDDPALYEWFEKLELEMRHLDRKVHGKERKFDMSADELRKLIDSTITRLQRQADFQKGVFPSRRVAPPAGKHG